MERHEIDIDNFIKERIKGFYPQKFVIEPTPDFAKQTMNRIYRLGRRRQFLVLYSLAALWALGPLLLRQVWLLIRNDYFEAANLPFGSITVTIYQFFLSWAGAILLLAAGILASVFFALKLRRSGFGLPAKLVKIA